MTMSDTPDGTPPEPDHQLLNSAPVGSPAHKLFADSLRTLKEHAPNEETARLYDDILTGRRSALDLFESEGFAQAAERGVQEYEEYRESLTEEEREELDRQAEIDARTIDQPPPDVGTVT